MQLIATTQVAATEATAEPFDIMIAASGYEARATHALNLFKPERMQSKIGFGFEDRPVESREDNDRAFLRAGFTLVPSHGDSGSTVYDCVLAELERTRPERVRLLIDYSSMTRTWYAAVLKAITGVSNKRVIEAYFSYSPAEFVAPHATTPNSEVGPISGFCGLDSPDKPTALIIGLGYERDRALGLHEYVDPAKSFAFLTDPPIDPRYRDVVLASNGAFLSAIGRENTFPHPLADLQRTGQILVSLYCGLRDNYRVILAPLGVKPFSLLCLLLSVRFGDVDVWRVTSGVKAAPQERRAAGPLLILKTTFGCDNPA